MCPYLTNFNSLKERFIAFYATNKKISIKLYNKFIAVSIFSRI
ncbi:hypothetical protein FHS11_000921 [Mucilaginibacter gotjawali]|uniref:Uncharacterized protein n=1 Tax=Mucilaginibacter gotjawali TaxID=1550579 RepID=A0A839S8Q6_9SPHI|nr:hypothetical protein [Mucilaginibacter gotjawali]